MCPDNNEPVAIVDPNDPFRNQRRQPAVPLTNPTLAEDDKFRRTITPAEGPNVDGPMNQIKQAHTLKPDGVPVSAADIAREDAASDRQSTEKPEVDAAVKSDVEPSMAAPDAVPMPSPSAVREE
jgi:hypothetical protein